MLSYPVNVVNLVFLVISLGVSEKAGYITPVPGGVGPMTIAMLLRNTLIAARRDIDYGHIHDRRRREEPVENLPTRISRISYAMIMKLLGVEESAAYNVNRRKN